jgi:hypothetical protein
MDLLPSSGGTYSGGPVKNELISLPALMIETSSSKQAHMSRFSLSLSLTRNGDRSSLQNVMSFILGRLIASKIPVMVMTIFVISIF